MRRKQFIKKTPKGLMCSFTAAHVSPEYSRTNKAMQLFLTDRAQSLEDQMLACLRCWKALLAAAS